ncbi:MAG: hypothetical protein ACPLX7_10295 [Candidatus Kapaibacteriota bacterium]
MSFELYYATALRMSAQDTTDYWTSFTDSAVIGLRCEVKNVGSADALISYTATPATNEWFKLAAGASWVLPIGIRTIYVKSAVVETPTTLVLISAGIPTT